MGNTHESKLHRFIGAQFGLTGRIAESMSAERRRRLWIHASSLGEYQIARPVLAELGRRMPDLAIVLTFFSPTGFDTLGGKTKRECGADYVFALPLDTPGNARRMLEAVAPEAAVFMVSELWPYYMRELKRRSIPVMQLSALLYDGCSALKWWGGSRRNMLRHLDVVVVHDDVTADRLENIGCKRVLKTGDPLFDNAAAIAATEWNDPALEKFSESAGGRVLVAGSVHDRNDVEIIGCAARKLPQMKIIAVPHEITEKLIGEIERAMSGNCVRLSEVSETTDMNDVGTLIVDSVGQLSRLYRYGRYSYVGGGFTRLLHSVIEPIAYGLPTSYGPRIERKATPRVMMELGIGRVVNNGDELARWIESLETDDDQRCRVHEDALKFVDLNSGSASVIAKQIEDLINKGNRPEYEQRE